MLALLKRISVPTRRYVLTVSNEGAVLAYIVSGSVMRHWVVTEVDDAARMLLRDILDERPRIPIIFLIDLLEQSYQIDQLAKLSPLDRSKAVKLKLNFLFPTFDIRAALRIPGKTDDRHENRYLFAALPHSRELEQWIDFLDNARNPVIGPVLLPVESSDMVATLASETTERNDTPGRWAMLITRHATGFRQIVVEKGALALTRLTPIGEGLTDPASVADLIRQEISSTLGYLTRLGYAADDGLDVFVIGSEALREKFEEHALPIHRLEVLTATEAAGHLGLANVDGGAEDENGEEIGELLHAGWAAGKRNPTLKLSQTSWVKRQREFVIRQTALAGLSASLALVFLYTVYGTVDWWRLRGDIISDTATRNKLTSRLNREAKARGSGGMELRKIVIPLDIYKRLSAETVDVMDAIGPIGRSLQAELRLRKIHWQIVEDKPLRRSRLRRNIRKRAAAQSYQITMTVDLNAIRNPEKAMAVTKSLVARLRKRFPKQQVDVVRQPLGIEATKSLSGASDEGISRDTGSGWFADLMISGPIK